MLTYEEAVDRVLTGLGPLPAQETPLIQALGQALARDLHAPISLPTFDNSGMDGYAGRFEDLTAGRPLPVVGESAAGRPFAERIAAGKVVRIGTGAPIPPGMDTVVPRECCEVEGGLVRVTTDGIEKGQCIRRTGEDVTAGTCVARLGDAVTPGLVGLLAAFGMPTVPCPRRPRVAIVATGTELVAAGTPLREGEIYNSNAVALEARVIDAGAEPTGSRHAIDTLDSVRTTLDAVSEADVIISSGGVSVGDHDYVKEVLTERGRIEFWRVAIRPGKPFVFGHLGDALFFGLPGNPVSTMVTFELFVRPVLRRMMGHAVTGRPTLRARLIEPVAHVQGLRCFVRVQVAVAGDGHTVRLCSSQGSAMLNATASANGLLPVPEDVDLDAGSMVDVIMLDFHGGWRP
ncbi:MAG: gephyrin-like molybdotransferase Glp [Capsulimonadaceae bacterium]